MDGMTPTAYGECYVVAIGAIPNRDDGLLSLHVGPCYVQITGDELQKLCRAALTLLEKGSE